MKHVVLNHDLARLLQCLLENREPFAALEQATREAYAISGFEGVRYAFNKIMGEGHAGNIETAALLGNCIGIASEMLRMTDIVQHQIDNGKEEQDGTDGS